MSVDRVTSPAPAGAAAAVRRGASGGTAARTVIARLALAGLLLSGCQTTGGSLQSSAAGYDPADPSVPSSPHARTRWKALLLAGDRSIKAFDNAVADLSALLARRGIVVAHRFTADPHAVSGQVTLATEANLRRAAAALRVAPGEGCLLYATSHGNIHGLRLTSDPDSGYTLSPAALAGILAAACPEAPRVVVMSGCHTGTFLRRETLGPDVIMLTAAGTYQRSFGCRAGRKHTYYDACFLREFPRAATWQALHGQVRGCVEAQEKTLREQPSAPQAFFGRQMKDLPITAAR